MPVRTSLGRQTINGQLAAQQWLMGIGSGDAGWNAAAPPAESLGATALMAPLIYRLLTPQRVTQTPLNVAGDIEVAGREYIVTSTGHQLYFELLLRIDDLPGVTVREQGLFLAPTVSEVNQLKRLLTPAQVTDPGMLIVLDHLRPALSRTPATVRRYQALVTF